MSQNFGFTGANLGQDQPWRLQGVCGENDRVPGTCELMCYYHTQKAGTKHSVLPPSMPFLEVTQYIKRGFVLNHTPSIAPGASGSVQLKEVKRKCPARTIVNSRRGLIRMFQIELQCIRKHEGSESTGYQGTATVRTVRCGVWVSAALVLYSPSIEIRDCPVVYNMKFWTQI